MSETKYLHSEITREILRIFYHIYNNLGYGFDKTMYIKAIMIELRKSELQCEAYKNVPIFYDTNDLGDIIADIVVENKVLIKIETKEKIETHSSKVLYNYLHACDLEVGLLLNFGKMPEQKRKYCDNATKQNLS